MKSPWRCLCRRRRSIGAAVTLACASGSVVLACGPEFPNSYYAMPEAGLLAAPEGIFAREVARIIADVRPRVSAVHASQSLVEIERAELRRALAERGIDRARAAAIEESYATCREKLDAWVDTRRASRRVRNPWGTSARSDVPDFPQLVLPAGLPEEFALYFEGAVAWHRDAPDEAGEKWAALLALPIEQRPYRSVSAAFMLGRKWANDAERGSPDSIAKRAEAQRFFALARSLAERFPDPLGLAAESLGWEARLLLRTRQPVEAIALYLEQYAAGDDTALESLRVAARWSAGENDERLALLARDERARRVLTAHFISRWENGWGDQSPPADLVNWTNALRKQGVRALPDADRLAWLAYEAGMFPLAWEWVKLAPEEATEARWVRAKLALRGGDLAAGASLLRSVLATPTLPDPHRERVAAELGRVCLARDDFAGALAADLAGGLWEDAAYVAERVMTADELVAFVDATPSMAAPSLAARSWYRTEDMPTQLRTLLARRLARLGRTEAAETYFSAELQPIYRAYVVEVRAGFDVKVAAADRAAAFWRAAQIVREHGMDILGTELDPDWAIWGGSYAMSPVREERLGRRANAARATDMFRPSELEAKRLETQRAPEKRFHYRYRAAELAWWAAALLPNDSEEAARILATAGGWLKARDPEAAKPFYQALVIRCGNTALGRAAAAQRWFPQADAQPQNE